MTTFDLLAPDCPRHDVAMEPNSETWINRYYGAPTHSCRERFCACRAWVEKDGTRVITRTTGETVKEISRRMRAHEEAKEAPSAGQG